MEIRYAMHPSQAAALGTNELRAQFLVQDLFPDEGTQLVYTHDDRFIVGGLAPKKQVKLEGSVKDLGTGYFLERREMGIINIGGAGTVTVDGKAFLLKGKDGLYIGKGAREVFFASADPHEPACFYFNSAPAHAVFPPACVAFEKAASVRLGTREESNERTIHKYFHPDGISTCQLVMGMTVLQPGSVWNSMPCHTHERRMEVYMYFNLPESALVFHFMGRPSETRHLVVRDKEAVIAPSWSIHSGSGTRNYSFIWGMAGENQTFTDMDAVNHAEIR